MKSLTGFLCAAALLAFPLVLDAGTPVKGKVSDASGAPVVGALVFEPGTSNGTMTDENGHYSIELSSGSATISFSLLGYNDITEKVNGRAVVDAVMTDDRQQLEEVVVVGYGVQKRGTLTGSVASINSEKLTKAPADNVANLLGGKLPGLVVEHRQSGDVWLGTDNGISRFRKGAFNNFYFGANSLENACTEDNAVVFLAS